MNLISIISLLWVVNLSLDLAVSFTINWLNNYNTQLLVPSYDEIDTIYMVQRNNSYSIVKYSVSTNTLSSVLDVPLGPQINLIFASGKNGGDIWFFTEKGILYMFNAIKKEITTIINTQKTIRPSSTFLVQSEGVFFLTSLVRDGNFESTNETCYLYFLNFTTQNPDLIGTFSIGGRNNSINLISDEFGIIYILSSGLESESTFFVVRNTRAWRNPEEFMTEPLEGHFSPMLDNTLRMGRFWMTIESTKVSYLQLGRGLAMSESVDFTIQNSTNYNYRPVYVRSKQGIYVFAGDPGNYNTAIGFIQTCQHRARPSTRSLYYSPNQWSTFSLNCDVPRSPKSLVEWKRTSPKRLLEDFRYDSAELVFPYIQSSSTGEYTCLAESICGYDSRHYFVDVRPRIALETRHMIQNVKIGSKAKFKCGDAIGKGNYIFTHVVWLQDNKILNLNPDRRIHITSSNDLEILGVHESDNGTIYTCLLDATSKNGNVKENYTFNIKVELIATQNHATEFGISVPETTTVPINYILFVVFATVVCMVGICLYFTYKNTHVQGLTTEQIHHFTRGQLFGEEVTGIHNDNLDEILYEKLPYDDTYELHAHAFQLERRNILGQGQFGIVYKGVLKVGDKLEDVAIKTTKSGQYIKELKILLSEIKIMTYIGQHPNIIRFLGAYTRQLKIGIAYLAVEFCAIGSLERFLRNGKHASDSPGYENLENAQPKVVTNERQSEWSYQIAIGMEYLASKNVIHADLSTRNILLASDLAIRITDFGLSRKMDKYDNYVKTGSEPLPWRWMAIESLESRTFSIESDVWSYGVTLWEIYSMGKLPYHNQTWSTDFVQQLKSGDRLLPPPHAVEEIYDEMISCWNLDPQSRPNFKQLAIFLLNLTYKDQSINYL